MLLSDENQKMAIYRSVIAKCIMQICFRNEICDIDCRKVVIVLCMVVAHAVLFSGSVIIWCHTFKHLSATAVKIFVAGLPLICARDMCCEQNYYTAKLKLLIF